MEESERSEYLVKTGKKGDLVLEILGVKENIF